MEPLHPRDLLKAMMFSALVIISTITASYAVAWTGPEQLAREATRKWVAGDANCSVVVIAPGKALTAAHCEELAIMGGTVDGLAVTAVAPSYDRDLATIDVPGLACPCVPVSPRSANIGEVVIVTGFPYGSPVVVLTRGEVQGDWPYEGQPHVLTTAPVAPGNSGGGVFIVNDDGTLLVVGVASKSPPQGALMLYVEPVR